MTKSTEPGADANDPNDPNAPKEPFIFSGGNKLFQVSGDDLVELERILPVLCKHLTSLPYYNQNTQMKVQIRKVKDIISNIRWDYQPWLNVTSIDA